MSGPAFVAGVGGCGNTFPGGTAAVFEAGHLPELRMCVRACACCCHTLVSIIRRVVFPIQHRKESLKVILICTFFILF